MDFTQIIIMTVFLHTNVKVILDILDPAGSWLLIIFNVDDRGSIFFKQA